MVWPLAVYIGAVVLLTAGMLAVSYFLGERHRERVTGEPYESGIIPTEGARVHIDIKYYLAAMLFVVFDIESVFIYAWAVGFKRMGWPQFWAMAVFMAVLLIALVYMYKSGVFAWGPNKRNLHRPQPGESL